MCGNIQIFEYYIQIYTMSQKLERQKTIDLGSKNIWGKLVPLASGLAAHDLEKQVVVIGRVPACDVQLNDKRLSSKHCQLQKKDDKIILTDLSTNGTYVKDQKIGKGVQIQVKHHTQIWLLPASKVKPTQALGFRLEITAESQKKQQEQQNTHKLRTRSKSNIKQESKQQQKPKQAKQEQKKDSFAQKIKQQITCAFCFEIMHGPVSVQPCNHRFCGGCLTQLVLNKKGDCIKCRKQITTAVKDASFNSIIDDYLKNHPEQKRDPKDIEEMNKKNIFTFDPLDVIQKITGKPSKKKADKAPTSTPVVRGRGRRPLNRTGSDLSASDQDQARCRQCMAARNGFQCAATQRHISCFTCGKLMADRANRDLHQYCVLCSQNFCNIYFPPCSKAGVKLQLIQNRRGESKIDAQLLRSNKFQFQTLRNYLLSKKLTSKQVFDFVMNKIQKDEFSYMIDRKIMKIPPLASREIKMKNNDAVCDLCWKDLWFQMVFFYRNQISSELPTAVRNRPTCYWGVNCRTMDHNDDHAKKYNHMIYQTRF